MPKRKAKRVTKPVAKRAPKKRSSQSKHIRRRKTIGQISRERHSAIVTETVLPRPKLGLTDRCRVCKLAITDFGVFDTINTHLIAGGSVPVLAKWCADNGHPEIENYHLSRHRRNHLATWLTKAMEFRMAAEAIAAAAPDAEADDQAVASLRRIDVLLLTVLTKLGVGDPEKQEDILKQVQTKEFQRLLDLQSKNAVRLAGAEHKRTQADRAEREIQLKELLIREKTGDFIEAAEAAFKRAFHMLSPDAQTEVMAALAKLRDEAA